MKETKKNGKKIRLIGVLAISILLILTIFGLNNNVNIFNRIIGKNETYRLDGLQSDGNLLSSSAIEITEDDERVGEIAEVKSVVVAEENTKTGTEPWDENDEPGNDSSDTNNIVRTFDSVSWTVLPTIGLKEEQAGQVFQNCILKIETTFSDEEAKYLRWDTAKIMAWASNVEISEDNKTFKCLYRVQNPEEADTIQQNLKIGINVYNAPNGFEIKPTFKFCIVGNEEWKSTTPTQNVIVSAIPKLNIKLKRNTYTNFKSYFDFETGNSTTSVTGNNVKYGRMLGYGISLQLYNNIPEDVLNGPEEELETKSKKLRGIAIPEGDIKFDIVLNEYTENGGDYVEQTNNAGFEPILWDYKENNSSDLVGKLGKNMIWQNITATKYATNAPYNSGEKHNACYDGGTWTIVQDETNKNTYHVTISNYKFNPDFKFSAVRNAGSSTTTKQIYGVTKGIGCFSSGYIQTLMQIPENIDNLETIKMKAEVKGLEYNTINQIGTEDQKSEDNIVEEKIAINSNAAYSKDIYYASSNKIGPFSGEDAKAYRGYKDGKLAFRYTIAANMEPEDWIYGFNALIKFDDEAIEPKLTGEQKECTSAASSGVCDLVFNILYAAKPDKTGWHVDGKTQEQVDEDMINSSMEDFIYFDTLEELKQAGYKCVGAMIETTGGHAESGTLHANVMIPYIVKDTAVIGNVYQILTDFRVYDEAPNRETQTFLNENATFPGIKKAYEHQTYQKTVYDSNGIITRHSNGIARGDNLLIVGGIQNITINAEKDGESNSNIEYRFEQGENIAKFKVTPSITDGIESETEKQNITGIKLKAEITLPRELKYRMNSSNYGEPQETLNEDGTTTLIWDINNCTLNEEIEPITFETDIDIATENGTVLTINASIAESSEEGYEQLIYNSSPESRKTQTTIKVINTASYNLVKSTETPLIERNGTGRFTISTINRESNDLTSFRLLDILPYAGDGRGTSYNGTYTIQKIVIKHYDITTGNEIENNDLTVYLSSNDRALNANIEDADLGTNTEIWVESTTPESINQTVKAFTILGTLKAKEKLDIEVYVKTSGNKENDVYVNSATAKFLTSANAISSKNISFQVIKRTLEGKVWLDANKNGKIDTGEEFLQGIKFKLVNQNGDTVKNTNNEEINTVTTDAEGYYKFENLKKGKYKVVLQEATDKKITTKNVGTDASINSKFNENGETDVITTLNNITNQTKENVNLGLIQKFGNVVVHHYIENTQIKLAEDEVISDKPVNSEYTTSKAENIKANYRVVEEHPSGWTGTISEGTTEVTYYYKLIDETVSNSITNTANKQKITQEDEAIKYTISYNITIKDYIGKATIKIVDNLPAEIDISKSSLANGTYDANNKTITWEENIENIDTYTAGQDYTSAIQKKITIVYKNQDVTQNLKNTATGYITTYYPDDDPVRPAGEKNTEQKAKTVSVAQEYKVEKTIEVVWDDNNNLRIRRPEKVQIQLTAENNVIDTIELSQAEQWKHTFTNLEKYNSQGKEIEYKVIEKEVNDGDLKFYEPADIGGTDTIVITNKYKLLNTKLDGEIEQTGTEKVTNSKETVQYRIEYRSTIKDYMGDIELIITDRLPYSIDVSKSNLNGGVYDENTKTITWTENIKNIDAKDNDDYEVKRTKTIKVVFKDLDATKREMTNEVKAVIKLLEKDSKDEKEATLKTKVEIKGKIIVKYVDMDTNKEIATKETKEGLAGETYEVKEKEIEKYRYVKNSENTKGAIKEGEQEIIFYYKNAQENSDNNTNTNNVIDTTQTNKILPNTGNKTLVIAIVCLIGALAFGIIKIRKYKEI